MEENKKSSEDKQSLKEKLTQPVQISEQDQEALKYVIPINRSAWAVAAGYLAFFCIVPVLNLFVLPATLLTAIMGWQDLKKNPKKLGKGRIIFGFVMVALGTPFFLLFIASFFK